MSFFGVIPSSSLLFVGSQLQENEKASESTQGSLPNPFIENLESGTLPVQNRNYIFRIFFGFSERTQKGLNESMQSNLGGVLVHTERKILKSCNSAVVNDCSLHLHEANTKQGTTGRRSVKIPRNCIGGSGGGSNLGMITEILGIITGTFELGLMKKSEKVCRRTGALGCRMGLQSLALHIFVLNAFHNHLTFKRGLLSLFEISNHLDCCLNGRI